MKITVWEENFGFSKERLEKLAKFYVLYYKTSEAREIEGDYNLDRAVASYRGETYRDAVRTHNNNHRRDPAGYVTTSKETADKWLNDQLDTAKIKTILI
jgi:hypothetical protein